MGAMSQRTKLTIFVFILVGIIFIVANWGNNKSLPVALVMLASPIAIAIASDRSPRLKATLPKIYGWLFIGIMGFGTLFILFSFLRGQVGFDVFAVIAIPILLLVGIFFVMFYLGPLLIKYGKSEAAEKLYTYMIRFSPNSGFAYLQRGTLRQNQQDLDRALLDYDATITLTKAKAALQNKPVLSVNFRLGVVYANKAEIYLNKRDPQQAILECNTGLTMNDPTPGVDLYLHYKRGYAQLVGGNAEAALQDFNTVHFEGKTAIHERTFGTDVNALKALTYWELNRQDEAKVSWVKAVAVEPKYNQADWLRDTRKWPDALIELAAIIRADLNNVSTS